MSDSICPTQADPLSQPRHGAGARFVRRLGSAVRDAIAGGLAHAGVLRRRPAASRPGIGDDRVAQDADAGPAPVRAPRTRRPRTRAVVAPSQPVRPDLPAPTRRRRFARFGRKRFSGPDVMHFTPEAFPALTLEACAFLNTPLEDCDPDIVLFLFSGLAEYLTALPEGVDMPDPMAVFATLWARLGNLGREALPDAPAAIERDAAPATTAEPLADAPTTAAEVLPDAATTPAGALPDAPTTPAGAWPDAWAIPPHPLPEAHSALPTNATAIAAIDASLSAPETQAPAPPLPEIMQAALPAPGPSAVLSGALDVVPFVPPTSAACHGDATLPVTHHRGGERATRRVPVRALPRSAPMGCPSRRHHPASPVGDRTFLPSNIAHISRTKYAPPRHCRYAARASPA